MYSRRRWLAAGVFARSTPCTSSATLTGDRPRSTGPCLSKIASINAATVCRLRSAPITALESSTNPRRGDSMVAGELQ